VTWSFIDNHHLRSKYFRTCDQGSEPPLDDGNESSDDYRGRDASYLAPAVQRCTDPRGDGVYNIEYRVVGKTDRVEHWIATRGQTIFANDAPVSFYGVALDVTDHKRIEETLERRVEARTRELDEANRQLRAQIKQREIAEAEVQQLQRLDAIGQITSATSRRLTCSAHKPPAMPISSMGSPMSAWPSMTWIAAKSPISAIQANSAIP
jgi:hypothetical protein